MKSDTYHRRQHQVRTSSWRRSTIMPAFNSLPDKTDHAYRPSFRRFKRITENWLQVGTSNILARITMFQHGGHTRPVVHRGSQHRRFKYSSVKTRMTELGEGEGEEFLSHYNEIATEVVYYKNHPFEIAFQQNGKSVRYRPDAMRMFADGRIEIIEVKGTSDELRDPALREKLAWTAEIARRCGMTFRILYLEQILGPCDRQKNVAALFCRRTMILSPTEKEIADRLIAKGRPVTWDDLRQAMAPSDHVRGDAIIERMLARGQLSTDLDRKFTSKTVLQPVKPFVGDVKVWA